jgi:hypothetical protein
MNIDEAIKHIENIMPYVGRNVKDSLDVAIRALEKQKELAEYSGYDICEWDFEEYQPVGRVDDFLIDEAKGEE